MGLKMFGNDIEPSGRKYSRISVAIATYAGDTFKETWS